MLRHDHIPDQAKGVAGAYFVENADETITGIGAPELWAPPHATEGDEVEVVLPVTAFKRVAQGKARKPAPLNVKGCGTRIWSHNS